MMEECLNGRHSSLVRRSLAMHIRSSLGGPGPSIERCGLPVFSPQVAPRYRWRVLGYPGILELPRCKQQKNPTPTRAKHIKYRNRQLVRGFPIEQRNHRLLPTMSTSTTTVTTEPAWIELQHAPAANHTLPKAAFAPASSPYTDPSDSEQQQPPAPAPAAVAVAVERWNRPRHNVPRVAASFYSLLVMGAQDALSGALITYMAAYYALSYTSASLIFLSPFVGYTASAATNNWVHMRLGQRGIAAICSACHVVAYLVSALHPPYPVLVVFYALAGFGTGLGDAGWNSWVGAMDQANELLGIMHACYGLGATLSPLIATAMITKLDAPWYAFYYVMLGAAVLEGLLTLSAFWSCTGKVFRESHEQPLSETQTQTQAGRSENRMKEALVQMPAARVTWTVAIFMLCYVGAEVSLGGWIVNFMLVVRHGEAFASGMVATGFWLGLTVGRVVLGFVTPRLGERLALMVRTLEPIERGKSQLIFFFSFCLLRLPRSIFQPSWVSSSSSGLSRNSTSPPSPSP